MDIFKGWENYTERLRANWQRMVKPDDTVILGGDFSWALKLEDTLADFKFLESLPGRKLMIKGNHDLWWSTAKKLREFWAENKIDSVDIIYNSCAVAEGFAIAGTRGWFYDAENSKKVLLREAGRLEMSLREAVKTGLPVLTFLHYPPVHSKEVCREIIDVLKRYAVNRVFYGHLHGTGAYGAVKEYEGIKFQLISCDFIEFTPYFIG